MHCLVTRVEGKGVRRPSSWATLQVRSAMVKILRKYMEHTGDPGREDHQELGLGCEKKPRALPYTRATTANESQKLKFGTDLRDLELGR